MTLVALLAFCSTSIAAGSPKPKFRHQTIDDKIHIGYGVTAADVDGDGKIDILLADKRQFVWYRNPTWQKFVIAENLTKRDNVCLAAEDLDGDGKCELAVGGDWDPNDRENSGAVFYMIPPEDRTQKWEPVKLHAEPTVHRMRWLQFSKGWGLIVAPLHGRKSATPDGPGPGSKVLCYFIPPDPRDAWEIELVDDSMHLTHNFDTPDVRIAGEEGVLAAARVFTRWSKSWSIRGTRPHPLEGPATPGFRGAGEVRHGHLRQDGVDPGFTVTVEPMHGNELVVYRLKGQARDRRVITDQMSEGHALRCGNLLAKGRDDIVVGWRGRAGGIRLFSCVDDHAVKWREFVIDDGGMACEDLCLADLNGDKKLDIIASGRATKNVKIYWNETPSPTPAQ